MSTHAWRGRTLARASGYQRVVTPSTSVLMGLAALCLIWAWQVYASWGAWGNLSIDSGHEMYIPAVLAEGKTLYRDVWFMYGPAAPYFNSYLFRLFGIHLNVLYWAGALSALGSAMVLYLIGRRLSFWTVGLAAGTVQILEAFHRSLFCFPLPYSFAAVYGCFVGSLFLWVATVASRSLHWGWMLAAGLLAATALLIKPEFGLAAYTTLGLLIIVRGLHKSTAYIGRDVATLLPGVLLVVVVVLWMTSLRGVEFITQENIVSWPTSYFMKNYGPLWMKNTGFELNFAMMSSVAARGVFPGAILLDLYCLFVWRGRGVFASALQLLLIPTALLFSVMALRLDAADLILSVLFPRDMVLYIVIAALIAWWTFGWQHPESRNPSVVILLSYSGLLAFRILTKMAPAGYAIYYNGPVVLCYLLIARAACMAVVKSSEARLVGDVLIFLAPVLAVAGAVGHFRPVGDLVRLTTNRGSILVPVDMAKDYQTAIAFMREKAAIGETVLSVPEDTSLYFLSETYCPIRVFSFTPGVLAPGKMTADMIHEIEKKRIRYLLWSNREFPEFGVPVFGIDFDREVGDYFRSRYQRLGALTPPQHQWHVDVWERKPE